MPKQSRYVLKPGHSGGLVEAVQDRLGLRVDGVFGPKTRDAVKSFQIDHNLKGDGIVGPMTWRKMGLDPQELDADTDITTGATWIEQYPLPDGEYVKQETAKKWIFIHHTAGRHNPYKVIDQWGRDRRGRIGTHYVIGGQPASGGQSKEDLKYDGRILQAFKDEYWGYHLGKTKSAAMHRQSISIEICSAGRLDKVGDKYYTWYKAEVHPDQVCTLEKPYKGREYYHKYSAKQIQSLKALLLLLEEKHGIDLQIGVIDGIKTLSQSGQPVPNLKADFTSAFNFSDAACMGKIQGLLTHGQVRKDKDDVQPQRELIEMLLTL